MWAMALHHFQTHMNTLASEEHRDRN